MMELIAAVIVKVETIQIFKTDWTNYLRLWFLSMLLQIQPPAQDSQPLLWQKSPRRQVACTWSHFCCSSPIFPTSHHHLWGSCLWGRRLCIFYRHPCVSPHSDPFVADFCAHRTAVESSYFWLHESAFVHGARNGVFRRKWKKWEVQCYSGSSDQVVTWKLDFG